MLKLKSLACCLIFLSSCKEQTFDIKKNEKYKQFLQSDLQSSPEQNFQTDSLFLNFAAFFNLPESEIQIRIWLPSQNQSYPKVFIIRDSGSIWNAEMQKITKARFIDHKMIPLEFNTQEFKYPKSGWPTFLGKILEYNVLTLPNRKPKLSDATDEDQFFFEIITPQKKRIYQALGFAYMNATKDEKEVENILKLIETEFGITWLDYSPTDRRKK